MLNDSENPSSISHGQITANSHTHIVDQEKQVEKVEEEVEKPSLSVWMTVILLVAVTTVCPFSCSRSKEQYLNAHCYRILVGGHHC